MTVVFTLFIYAMVILLRVQAARPGRGRGHLPRLDPAAGASASWATWSCSAYVVYDDPASLVYCAALLGVGLVLFLLEYFFGRRDRPADRDRGAPAEV